MSCLQSGFNNAAHLEKDRTTGAIKAAPKPSAKKPAQLLLDLPRQHKANTPIRSTPGYEQLNCLQVLVLDLRLE